MLAVAEAVSNAIDHGSVRDPSQIVTVEVALRQSKVIARIGDRGHWQPGLKALLASRGRGHLIMEALAGDVDINLDQGGTVVTLQFDAPSPAAVTTPGVDIDRDERLRALVVHLHGDIDSSTPLTS